jgi:hypothetical protein
MSRIALTLVLVAACGPLAPTAPRTARAGAVKCQQVVFTGSMMDRMMCRSQDDADESRAALQSAMSVPKQGASAPGPNSGGGHP